MSLRVAKRYAQALYELLQGRPEMQQVLQELEAVESAIRGSEELSLVLGHPQIRSEQKKELLKRLFAQRIGELTMRFLSLLLDKKRERELPDVVRLLRKYVNQEKGVLEAYVASARELAEGDEQALAEALSREFGKKVELHLTVDPSLIGGVQVLVENRLYDGSVAGMLKRFEQQISQRQAR